MAYLLRIVLFLFSFCVYQLNAQYCTPSVTCSSIYNISNVTFGTINNTSATCSISGYSDFTVTVASATVPGGKSTPISVTLSAGSFGYIGVWIDYNHNNIFDVTEFSSIGSGNGVTITNNIFIPSVAQAGTTRMRVRRRAGNTPFTSADACATYANGETEDYSVTIVPPPIVIYYTPFSDTLYDRVLTITARITQKDVGLNTSETLRPRLWFKRVNSASWKSAPGDMISGTNTDGTWQFPINHDSINIRRNGCDSVQYYFVAQDLNTPFNLGYLPEPGALHVNVTTQLNPPPFLFGYRLKPRLRDTVFVSSSDCRYQSLSGERGLFQDINNKGLEGELTILIESNLTENGTYDVKGTSLNGFKLMIRPSGNTMRTITQNAYNSASIVLNGAKNVLVDGSNNGTGRYLKFKNYSSGSYDTLANIKLFNSCDSIILRNLLFEDVSPVSSGGEFSVVLSSGNNKNISILNNKFTSTDVNIMADRYIASNFGNNTALIRGNEFDNFREYAIKIYAPCNNWVIDSNHFYRTLQPAPFSYNFSAISVMGSGHAITRNYVGGNAPFCAGAPMTFVKNPGGSISGIEAVSPGSSPITIENNRVDNISIGITTAAQTNSFAGILSANNNTIIRNNTIGNPASANHTIAVLANYIYGINVYGAQPVEITNNTIASIKDQPDAIFQNLHSMQVIGISKTSASNGNPSYISPANISGNTIHNLYNDRSPVNTLDPEIGGTIGIFSTNGLNTIIEKNLLYNISCKDGKVSGIGIITNNSLSTSIVQRNKIYDLRNTDLANGGCCGDDYYNGIINGIAVSNSAGAVDILNNQITLTNGSNTNPVSIRGIYEAYSNAAIPRHRIIYNSVYIGGTASLTGGSGAYVSLESSIKDLYNNIFYNERAGGTKGHFAIRILSTFFPASFLTFTKSNHNLYVLTDTTKFAHWGTNPSIGWGAWKNNTSLDDTSYIALIPSIPVSQLFIDKNQGNLNIDFTNPQCWNVNEKARPFDQITSDYDSLLIRNTSLINGYTDIGSDEFITNIMAPGGVCSGAVINFVSNLSGTTYQWQQKTAAGFINLANNANYSGVTTSTLQISNTPYSWNGNVYRCTVNGNTFSTLFILTVVQTLTPSVSITSPVTTACAGTPLTFTATPSNAGVNPSFQWLRNGTNVGTGNNVLTISTLSNGDIISVRLTSGAACVSSVTAVSNNIQVIITTPQTLSISISGNTTVLQGNATLLTSVQQNGGANPQYQWQDSTAAHTWQNIAGATGATLNYTPAQTGNKVRCRITSNANCVSPVIATSNELTFTVSTVTAINPVPGSNYGIRYFPNPVNSRLYIDSLKLSDKWQTFEIISLDGKHILISTAVANKTKADFNVEYLPAGQYIGVLRRKTGFAAYLKFIKL